jgi:hypothetical protein
MFSCRLYLKHLNMRKMFPLRQLFARFCPARPDTSALLQRFCSATELPHGTVRTVTLPVPVVAPKSRYAHLPRIFARAALFFLPAVLLVTFLTIRILRYTAADQAQLPAYSQDANEQQPLDISGTSQPQRPIFPYSIVPGGVRDARELLSATSRDPVVAEHYSDFGVDKARTVRLEHPLAMYVSYRRNNHVYWTKNRVVIPAGETLISDGNNLARVRCGNRLSAVAAKPVSVSEPGKEELNTPEFVPPLMAEFLPGDGGGFSLGAPASAIPALPPGPTSGSNTPPPAVLPSILLPGVPPITPNIPTTPPPPPVATPEPGTLVFLFAGMTIVALLVGLTLRRNGSS